MTGGVQNAECGQDVVRRESHQTTSKGLDGTVLKAQRQRVFQNSQMKLLEALTPQEQKTGGFDTMLLNTIISDLQTEPPSIFDSIETNSRYKDVSELFFLFEKHDSDRNSSDASDRQSDDNTL
jgi:hypothetical protein